MRGRRESRRLALLSSSSKSTFRGFSPSHSALVQDGRRRPTGQLDISPRSPRPDCSLTPAPPAAGSRPTPISANGSLAATRGRPRPARGQRARQEAHHSHPPRGRATPARPRAGGHVPRRRSHVRPVALFTFTPSPQSSSRLTDVLQNVRRFVQESRNNVENTLREKMKDASEQATVLDKKAKVRC